jgi:zinc transport system permease protein
LDIEPFLLRAAAAGIAVAVVAGPLGCFVLWRRMAYFGDTMAHSALLGVAAGFLISVNVMVGVIAVTVGIALALIALQRSRPWLSTDAVLGILSHSALSFGLVALGLLSSVRIDLLSYLFGDILSVGTSELYTVWGGGALVLLILASIWRPLFAATVHEDLARAEGVAVTRAIVIFTALIAVTIALAMKIVGILLITSLLIIPAATARRFAGSPEAMAVIAALLGVIAVIAGLAGSMQFDTPSGPSVVVAAALVFGLSQLRLGRRQVSAGDTAT